MSVARYMGESIVFSIAIAGGIYLQDYFVILFSLAVAAFVFSAEIYLEWWRDG